MDAEGRVVSIAVFCEDIRLNGVLCVILQTRISVWRFEVSHRVHMTQH